MRVALASLLTLGSLSACGSVVTHPDPMGEVSISPRQPKTTDDLVATTTGAGAGVSLRWSKNGTEMPDIADSVDRGLTTKGEVWRVELVDDSGTIASDEVTIVNSAPAPPVLGVAPDQHFVNAPITCAVTMPAVDPDGDPVTYLANWTKNGMPFLGATMTTLSGDTVPGSQAALDDVFVCSVTATDGADVSLVATAVATVNCLATGIGLAVFNVNGTPPTGMAQTFTVPPNVCRLTIEAGGGEGGDAAAAGATRGAKIVGTVLVMPAAQILILVGQRAGGVGGGAGQKLSGGGGTFVVGPNDTPLVIAGGGGSNFSGSIAFDESVGRAVTSGGTTGGTPRSDNGAGGSIAPGSTSGAGAGFMSNGAGGAAGAGGGRSFLMGGAGGGVEAFGGFGGGGGRTGSFGQGAGGGYSGGSCGDTPSAWLGCGGGGSFNGGTNQTNLAGAIAGDGYVRISW